MQSRDLIKFQLPKNSLSDIMVLGVGGAGCNAVNYMHSQGINNVVLAICNTDKQPLNHSNVPIKIQLGDGGGAGNNPDKARRAAIESLDEITDTLKREGTKMLFLAAGMGGGTGTGASAVIAKAAKDMGILTVGIVSLPTVDEGPKRVEQAKKGLDELRQKADSLVIVHNDNIAKMYGHLTFEEALNKADEILAHAAKSIAELVSLHYMVNVDMEDVRTVMLDSGLALMGSARARGSNRIEELVKQTLNSPLLNYRDMRGAKNILFNLSYGKNSKYIMSEHTQLLNLIQRSAGSNIDRGYSDIIWGAGSREDLDDEIELTVIATGFDNEVIEMVKETTVPDTEPIKPEKTNESIVSYIIRKGKEYIEKIDMTMERAEIPI